MRHGRLPAVGALSVLLVSAPGCTPTALRHVDLPGRPSAVAVAGETVWIADDERHVVRAFVADAGARAGDPVRVPRNPVALAAGRDAIWVGHATGDLTRIDLRTRRTRTVQAGGSITGIAARGSRVWATDLPARSLVEIDARTMSLERRYRIDEGAVRVAAAGDELWVTNSERTVTRVDPRSRQVGPVVRTGLGPIGLAFDGRNLWVANSDDGTLSRIDTTDGETLGRPVGVGRGPVALAVAGGSVWVANQDDETLSVLDADSGRTIEEPIALESRPRGVAADADAVYVVGTNPSRLVRVEL